jgi:hypothetical protein
MLKGVVNFYYTFQIYLDMFRQVIAIFRGLHVPYKLLQYCLCFGRMWIMIRSVWPAAVELLIYPDMFRQVIAIFRGLHVPY